MPALVIAAMIPGVFKFLVDALRWHAGDHVGPLGDGVFNVWAAGKLVLSGHVDAVFDHYLPVPTVDGVALRSSPYPPSMLLIAVPFGLFSPAVGVVLFGPKGEGAPTNGRRKKNVLAGVAGWLGDLWN